MNTDLLTTGEDKKYPQTTVVMTINVSSDEAFQMKPSTILLQFTCFIFFPVPHSFQVLQILQLKKDGIRLV